MTELQQKIFDMFKWFHSFCVENGIKYYAQGGTALGAVRHAGFIPWDDDIDVGLPRSEYDKLIALMEGKSFGDYVLEKPLENEDFVYGYCKIYDTTTTLIENTRYRPKRGIFIDIFPLDGAGNEFEDAKLKFRNIIKRRNKILIKTCAVRKGRKFYKNVGVILGRFLPYSWRKKAKQLDECCREIPFEQSKYVANFYGAWGIKELFSKDCLGEPVLYRFESGEIYLPQNAHEYLSSLYGDYMTPPPIEKQVTHHDFVQLDLNESYLLK